MSHGKDTSDRSLIGSAWRILAWALVLAAATRLVYKLPSEWWWVSRVGASWLAGAFAIGATTRRPVRGALLGAFLLVAAVLWYYAILGFVQHAYEASPFGLAWLLPAVPGGLAFGALGALWRSGRAPLLAASLLAATFAGEAVIAFAARHSESRGPVLLLTAVMLPLLLVRGADRRVAALALAGAFTVAAVAGETAVLVVTGYAS
jgi:hypothetical protein